MVKSTGMVPHTLTQLRVEWGIKSVFSYLVLIKTRVKNAPKKFFPKTEFSGTWENFQLAK
jgi:hypothetical protein